MIKQTQITAAFTETCTSCTVVHASALTVHGHKKVIFLCWKQVQNLPVGYDEYQVQKYSNVAGLNDLISIQKGTLSVHTVKHHNIEH